MKKILYFIVTIMLASNVFAQDANEMKSKILNAFPNMQIESIEYIKSINLYEMKIKDSPKYAYTNSNIDFFLINGELINPKNKSNYSQNRDLFKVQDFYKTLPFDKAIKIKYGSGEKGIAVFTDPDCPFCRALDQDIHTNMTNENITIYYFMNPLPLQGHENSSNKAKIIMCSKDPAKAWISWMTNNVLPDNSANCSKASNVDFTSNFAKNNGFTVTPIIILENGISATSKVSSAEIKNSLNFKAAR